MKDKTGEFALKKSSLTNLFHNKINNHNFLYW